MLLARVCSLALLQVIILHTLEGVPIRLDANGILVFLPTPSCAKGAGAVVTIGSNKLCVKETPERICEIIKPFKTCEEPL